MHLSLRPKGSAWLRLAADDAANTPVVYAESPAARTDLILKTKGSGLILAQNDTSGTTYVATRVEVPSTATSAGVVGQIAADASYIYMCIGTNSWVRASAASW